jgi:hypothetical protein
MQLSSGIISQRKLHRALVVDKFSNRFNRNVSGKTLRLYRLSMPRCSGISVESLRAFHLIQAGLWVRQSGRLYRYIWSSKEGHLLYPGLNMQGRLFIEDIGFRRNCFTLKNLNRVLKKDVSLLIRKADIPIRALWVCACYCGLKRQDRRCIHVRKGMSKGRRRTWTVGIPEY